MELKNFFTYQLAKSLYRECEDIRCPYFMKDQLLRASLSVVLNLAEGSGKGTKKDQRRFFQIAMGSLREVQAVLDILEKIDTAKNADFVGACIYRLIHSRPP